MNYRNIIEKLNAQLIANGYVINDVDAIFKNANEHELEVLTNTYKTFCISSSIYDEEDLIMLKNYNFPKKIIDFYREYSPSRNLIIHGGINLFSLNNMKKENSDLAPSAYLIKYGVFAFANTFGGNAICMDLNMISEGEPRIIIADHSVFCDKELYIFRNGQMENLELSYDVIKEIAPQICSKFTNFLEMAANEEFDDIENFLE